MDQSKMKATYGTAILKAAMILDYLALQPHPIGVSEIAAGTKLNKATTFKILETLQAIDWVEKTSDSQYRLGVGLVKLGHASAKQVDLIRIAMPHLQRLNDETGETIHLGVLRNLQVVYIVKLESKQVVRMYSEVGKTAPLYCTGIGKAILSTFQPQELEDYLTVTPLKRYTENTIVSICNLKKELEHIRQVGYAIDNEEHELDVRCVAMPLYQSDHLYGAFSISGPSFRMTDAVLRSYVPLAKECQEAILQGLDGLEV
ncbi:MAG: IclR family transcriptional regulator [Alicyclobacillus sp.]|nr:IclR family transcriptional regulator [Alicyclobacillus sp.]